MRNYLLLLFFLTAGYNLSGQSIAEQNISWSVDSFSDSDTNETINYSCHFESTPALIKMIQKGGTRVYEFQITDRSGAWNNVNADGQTILSVTFRGNSGTIKFKRSQQQISIETNIPVSGKNIMPYTFTVNSISIL
jgi:hypothetical protein